MRILYSNYILVVHHNAKVCEPSLRVGGNILDAPGEKNTKGLRAISPRKCINRTLKKIKKEPLKIAIDCNVKACSMLQIYM